jgi:hypothetical protein
MSPSRFIANRAFFFGLSGHPKISDGDPGRTASFENIELALSAIFGHSIS